MRPAKFAVGQHLVFPVGDGVEHKVVLAYTRFPGHGWCYLLKSRRGAGYRCSADFAETTLLTTDQWAAQVLTA